MRKTKSKTLFTPALHAASRPHDTNWLTYLQTPNEPCVHPLLSHNNILIKGCRFDMCDLDEFKWYLSVIRLPQIYSPLEFGKWNAFLVVCACISIYPWANRSDHKYQNAGFYKLHRVEQNVFAFVLRTVSDAAYYGTTDERTDTRDRQRDRAHRQVDLLTYWATYASGVIDFMFSNVLAVFRIPWSTPSEVIRGHKLRQTGKQCNMHFCSSLSMT